MTGIHKEIAFEVDIFVTQGSVPMEQKLVELDEALLLGGVSAVTLARAGRIETDDPERIARIFQTVSAPRLSFWY